MRTLKIKVDAAGRRVATGSPGGRDEISNIAL
jgi:hypothetical protein